MRAAPLLILSCLVSAPAFAGAWSNLWRTPDQQGEALLAAGRPAQAAARFTSPRRKAYADLEAGRYARAAHLLARFKDATSEYNRGNALAHLGHLHGALAAYDAALKQAPHDRDIRHNRDLVARILAHRPPQHRPTRQHAAGKHSGQAGARRGSGGQNAGQHGQGKAGGARRGTGHNPGANAARSGNTSAGKQGSGKHSAARAGGHAGGRANPRAGAAQSTARPGTNPHRPGQARRDAALAAAIARQARRRGSGSATAGAAQGAQGGRHRPAARSLLGHVGGGKRSAPPKPVSEKKLALEQWLRQIPNDPAGLLRRKFLIQYLLRHPGANQ